MWCTTSFIYIHIYIWLNNIHNKHIYKYEGMIIFIYYGWILCIYTYIWILFRHKKYTLSFATAWIVPVCTKLSEISQRQMVYNFTYMWHLKTKQMNEQQNRNRLIDTQNKQMVVRRKVDSGNEWNRWGRLRETNF